MSGMDLESAIETWTDEAKASRWQQERNELLRPALQRPTRIVAMGGGTGLPVVLRGLARKAEPKLGDPGVDITAVVTMSDDGGSSGRLRRSHGVLPPGDIRNCLVALAGGNSALAEVFQYRFGGAKGLAGHAVGNLLIAALAELKGDFLEAVRVSAELLGVRGQVLPCTLAPVQLVAQMHDATEVVGERNIVRAQGRVAPGVAEPSLAASLRGADRVHPQRGSHRHRAGLAVLERHSQPAGGRGGPGAARDAGAQGHGGQPDDPAGRDGRHDCLDHVRAVIEHAGPVLDAVLVNAAPPPTEAIQRYARKGAYVVPVERRELISAGVIPVEADLLKEGSKIRHDSRKIARCLLKMARSGL